MHIMPERGYIQQLAEYIKKNLAKGYTIDSLKIALESQGYSKVSIERAVNELNEEMAKEAPKIKEKPVIRYEVIEEVEPKKEKKSFFKRLWG